MSKYEPTKRHLREVLLFHFNVKKTAAETHRILVDAYGESAPSERTCREWFQRFKSGDFNVEDHERSGRLKEFEDAELQHLLDVDSRKTQEELAEALNVDQSVISRRLKAMGKIQKEGVWLPYQLKERDIERRLVTCEMLLARQRSKSFLHRIITGDEKWVYYDNPKRRKSWVSRGEASTSVPKRNIHGSKIMLCIWWDQKGVLYYELLKPSETITGDRYRQQLIKLNRAVQLKRPQYADRHGKVIFQHDNARPHVHKSVKETLESFKWELLPHPLYSPDIAPS